MSAVADSRATAIAPSWRQRWLAGLTLKGLGLILLICAINAVRRMIQSNGSNAAGGQAPQVMVWLTQTAHVTAWGLMIAVPVALAVIAAWNLSPPRPRIRHAVVTLAMAAAAATSIAAATYVEYVLDCPPSDMCYAAGWTRELVAAYARYGSLCALFTVVFVYLRIAEESTARSQRAEVDRARFVQRMEEARLRMLQAQIEPHFLFNTLANVRRLYQTAPGDGAAMLDHLMRYLEVALPQMRAAASTLEREAALTRSYLEIQRLRMGHRLSFDIDIPQALRAASVPPMMIVTLAENAIKHGLAPLPGGGHVAVTATVHGPDLQVRVSDSGQGFTHSSGGGTGLANIRARLSAMYGDRGRLSLALNTPRGGGGDDRRSAVVSRGRYRMMDARLAVRFARDSWRGITRRQMLATFLLAVALFIYHFASGLATDDDPFEWTPVLVIFVGDQIKVWPLLLAFSVVEHIGAQDEDRRVAYAMAALLGTLVAAPLAVIFVSAMFNLFVHPARPRVGFMIYIGLETAMFGAAILWIINDRRRALRARARMHRAELERIAAEKRSIESDLQAMQARVEPQFLFNTLARVRTLYEQDGTRGEHMLDELIAYLRAAMPRMRDTSSTVHQEIDLVRAYLAIVKVRMDERFTYDIDVPPQSYGVRMPPMMLLPLVDDAVGRDADDASAPRAIRIVIEAGASQLTARVTERGRRAPPAHRHALDAIRERLDALYGGAAKVAYRPAGEHAAQVIIEIPIETPVTAARLVTLRGTDAATGPPSARPAPL